MGKAVDLTGKKIEMLTILERKRENNRTYYYCKCDCGNEKWIRADSLKETKSCGCLQKLTQFKARDLTGERFGRLVALEPTDKRTKWNGCIVWKCKCDCGNYTEVPQALLIAKKNNVRSCGCLAKESQKKVGEYIGSLFVKNKIIENTNVQVISRDTLQSNNTSGVTGVRWDSSRKKWLAEIRFKNKVYYLGRFEDKKDAIEVRKEAEEKLHKKFLREKGFLKE